MVLRQRKMWLFFLCLFLVSVSSVVYAGDESIIYWSQGTKLQFADFKGSRNGGDHSYVGKTAATVVPRIKYGKDSFYYKVDCVFQKDISVIVDRRRSVLEHEQGHFDITEIVARQIRKDLSTLSPSMANAASVNNILTAAYKLGEQIQEAYETDCGYGETPVQQNAWNRRIRDMLNTLKDYEQPARTVRLN